MFEKFPYTSFEKINLDWIMKTLNKLKDAIPLVQQASTIYTQALEALATANETVSAVTTTADAALNASTEALGTANNASTTANTAQLSAELATTTANGASTTAGEATTAAAAADTKATTALARASEANESLSWGYKGSLMRNTPNEMGTITIPMLNIPHSMILVFSAAPSWSSYTNRSVEIPRAFLLEENQSNGTAPRTAAGMNIAIGTPSATWTINVLCDGESVTVRHVSADTSQAELYCRVYAR